MPLPPASQCAKMVMHYVIYRGGGIHGSKCESEPKKDRPLATRRSLRIGVRGTLVCSRGCTKVGCRLIAKGGLEAIRNDIIRPHLSKLYKGWPNVDPRYAVAYSYRVPLPLAAGLTQPAGFSLCSLCES
jgi:hypothetical protein